MAPAWCSEYVGIPFSPKGRDRSGCDCWGLARLVLLERFGVDLPSLAGTYEGVEASQAAPAVAAGMVDLGAVRVVDPRPGDVVLFRFGRFPCHVGVCLGSDEVLHVERGRNSIVQRLSSPYLAPRTEGFYRVG